MHDLINRMNVSILDEEDSSRRRKKKNKNNQMQMQGGRKTSKFKRKEGDDP